MTVMTLSRLIITIRKKGDERDMVINTGLFDRAEITRGMNTLHARLAQEAEGCSVAA